MTLKAVVVVVVCKVPAGRTLTGGLGTLREEDAFEAGRLVVAEVLPEVVEVDAFLDRPGADLLADLREVLLVLDEALVEGVHFQLGPGMRLALKMTGRFKLVVVVLDVGRFGIGVQLLRADIVVVIIVIVVIIWTCQEFLNGVGEISVVLLQQLKGELLVVRSKVNGIA